MTREETITESLIALLIERDLLKSDDAASLKESFAQSEKSSFTDFLRQEGLVEPEHLLEVLGELYQKPAFDVVGHFFDHNLLVKFPKGFLLREGIIPLEQDGNMLVMIAGDPENPDLLEQIGEHVSYDIRFNVGLRDDICDAVKEFYEEALTQDYDEYGEDIESEDLDEDEDVLILDED